MPQIGGQRADDNDNNPVEVRHYQILGGGLDEALGRFPTSPIRYRHLGGSSYIFWQYFPNGIIISTSNSCACVLYGPIYHYWDQTGQFDGPFGAPTTDLLRLSGGPTVPGMPPPPPGASFCVFEHGVLYLEPAIGASVQVLSPVSPDLIASGAGVVPTGPGIAQAAQATIQGVADNALATDQTLADNVDSISTRTSFNSIGPGGCAGGGFDAVGRSLLRSHILNVHFDFDLSGCASTFGDATADLRIEIRLFINPPRVTARLVNYWIDAVSSPFGAGDQDVRDGLMRALNGQFGRDLLNRPIPSGVTVIAGIVETNGDVNLYIAPICASTAMLMRSGSTSAESTLGALRQLRDWHLVDEPWGGEFIALVDVLGPVFTEALRREKDAPELRAKVADLLARTFPESGALDGIAEKLAEPVEAMRRFLALPGLSRNPRWPDELGARAVRFVREHVREESRFADLLDEGRKVIEEETRRHATIGDGQRSAD